MLDRSGAGHYSPMAAIVWFWGTCGILLAAFILTTEGERQVFLPGVHLPIPETCGTRLQFGFDCPGCGLTRGFIYIAHGDLEAAWHLNFVSVLAFAFVLAQPVLAAAHWFRLAGQSLRQLTRLNELALGALFVMLVVRWLWRLASGDLF